MTVVTKYGLALNNFADIKNTLRDVMLRLDSQSVSGNIATDDELSFWVNKCYALLENYGWSWARKKDPTGITTVAGTSTYQLPIMARDKKPLIQIFNSTYNLKEVPSLEEYNAETFNRSGSGTPRRFAYVDKYTTARTYATGTITGVVGAYTLTGSGTSWLSNLFCGSTITPAAGTAQTVARVNSDTQVTLTAATGAITAGTAYSASTSYPLVQIDFDPIPSAAVLHTFWYAQKFVPLILDADVPLLPLNDRWVLVDGAYSLYKWFHDEILKSGISPSVSIRTADAAFLTSPASVQKFFDQYVAKLLADDRQLVGTARPKMKFKRCY